MLLLLPFVSSSLLLPAGRSVRLPESSKIARSSASRTRNSFPNGPARQVDANAGSATQVWLASPKVAARAGRVEALLEAGAPLEAANGSCFTPLDRAILMGNVELVKALREATNGSCSMPLEGAILVGNVELVKALLYVGASLETEDASSLTTPLNTAIILKNVPVVKALLEAGASPEAEGANTPLNIAIHQGNVEIIEILIDAGASLAPDVNSPTPLDIAIHEKNVEVIEILIDAGASLAPDASSSTPLEHAIYYENVDVIQALLDAGASLDSPRFGATTPLLNAMIGGNVNVIKQVLLASLTTRPLMFASLLILWLASLDSSLANGSLSPILQAFNLQFYIVELRNFISRRTSDGPELLLCAAVCYYCYCCVC